jgi:hypothetical protein
VFFQEGAVLSSKSAINVLAPEFKALMIIFSIYWSGNLTRLSCKSCGMVPAVQFEVLTSLVLSKFGNFPLSKIVCCSSRRCNISSLSALNFHAVQ